MEDVAIRPKGHGVGRHSVFDAYTKEAMVGFCLLYTSRGMGDITFAQVRGNLNARIASGEFQAVERAHMPGRQFTTAKTIAAEHEIIGRVREGRNQIEPLLPRSQAIAFADQHLHLNRTQRSVVEDVLSSPDRIQGVQGLSLIHI